MWDLLMIDDPTDLWFKINVSVIMFPSRTLISLGIDLAWAVNNNEYDVCLTAHGPEVLGDAAREDGVAPQSD